MPNEHEAPSAPAAPTAPNWLPIAAQLTFVVIAALFAYGFVSVSKEGEIRRVCSAPCFLHPDYMAADRRAPPFILQELPAATPPSPSMRGHDALLTFSTDTWGPSLPDVAR